MTEITWRLSTALADRYTIERELGEGGMATVYLAEDVKHDRKVALKVLKPELAAVLGAERFVQEIKTTANLQHPHILPLFDSGEADSFLYYVMPFIDGETLRDKLDRETQLGVDEAVKITTEVADALDYAHRNNVIHRDIKPENILLHDGRPMVADFGIALAVSAAAGGRMTETGLSLGTPHYMSPEQATADRDLTNRSDIYSLGAMLYEMLTGDPPHTGSSAQQIIMRIVTEEPQPVTRARKTVPPNVAAAVGKALEKLPADRFESASTFAAALGDLTFTTPRTIATPARGDFGPRSGQRWKLLAAAMSLLLLGVTAGWIVRPIPETARRAVQFVIESDSVHTILPGSVAVSPDGSVIVYGARTASGSMLYRRRTDELQARPIDGTQGGRDPFFSPDGTELGFVTGGAERDASGRAHTIRSVRLDGGTPRTIADQIVGVPTGTDWGTDDTIVFTTWWSPHVYLVSADGGTPDVIDVVDEEGESVYITSPQFLSSDVLLFSTMSWAKESRVGALALESGNITWLTQGAVPRYMQSGHLVYVDNDGSLFAQPFDVAKLETVGEPRRVTEGIGSNLFRIPWFTTSSSGTFAYNSARFEGSDLVMVDRSGNERLILADPTFWIPRFSPDGNQIAFGTPRFPVDVWVHDLVGGTTSRLTLSDQCSNNVLWNPQGTSIAFKDGDCDRGSGRSEYLVAHSPDRGITDTLVVGNGKYHWGTDWSPDGRYLVFTRTTDQDGFDNRDIWIAPLNGNGGPRPVVATPFQEDAGRVSPNGRWLAYDSNESGQYEVYIQTFPEPGGKTLISAGGGEDPMWGRDGRELFYWNPQRELVALQLTAENSLTIGQREVLFAFPSYESPVHAQYDVHPDGQHFVIRKTDTAVSLVVALDVIDPIR